MQPNSTVFRLAKSEEELERLLKFRYHAFDRSNLRMLLTPNRDGLDLDSYDVNAHHVGLFVDDEPVGYARLITRARGPQAGWIEAIVQRHPLLRNALARGERAALPSLNYAKDATPLRRWLAERPNSIEASRFSLASEHSMPVARFMTHALVSYWRQAGFDGAVIVARESHARMWAWLGFRVMPGVECISFQGVNATLMTLAPAWIPARPGRRVLQMVDEFNRNGHLIAA